MNTHLSACVATLCCCSFSIACGGSPPVESLGGNEHGEAKESRTGLESDMPDPSQVSITATTSGCGFVDTQISADKIYYAVTFREAQAGRSQGYSQDFDCNVTFTYKFPAGYTFDAPSVRMLGYAMADESSSVTINASESLAGTARTSKTVANGSDDLVLSLPPGGQAGSAPCGADTATVNVHISSTFVGTGDATFVADWFDGAINWHRCP